MRKKVFLILTSLVLLIIFILVFLNFFVDHSESNKKKYEIKNSETIKKEKTKKEDDLIDDSQNDETNNEDYGDSNSSDDVSINKSNKNNMGTNNASHSNVVNNNSNNESNNSQTNSNSNQNNNNYISTTPAPEPVKELTEWEKLGISEYDYYNTPSDNEGELAFKGSTGLCQNEINRLVNTYYDSGIDGGNYYTVNGKYTHSYLGCGIKMYMNGNAYIYSQIKSMGFN